MGKSSKSVVVGFKYFATMHYGICLGPIDSFRSIRFADKVAWSGNIQAPDNNGSTAGFYVDNPGLFGGDESEGGVFGWVEAGMGADNQTITGVEENGAYDTNRIKQDIFQIPTGVPGTGFWDYFRRDRERVATPSVPEFAVNYRGIAILNLQAFCLGNNAYLKDLAVEVERTTSDWYPEKARVFTGTFNNFAGVPEDYYGMNAVHVIYESITSKVFGLGLPASAVDQESFKQAADTAYDEGIGLSTLLGDDQSVETFIVDVTEVLMATVFNDPATGLFRIKLLRKYDEPVMTFTPDNSSLNSFRRRSLSETYNEITARYVNILTEKFETTTVHDLANIQAQGQVIPMEKTYVGVRSEALAQALAQRDLQAVSATLASAVITTDMSAWQLVPGDVVILNRPELGITALRMRVFDKTIPSSTGAQLTFTLNEDVYGQSNAVFTKPQVPGGVVVPPEPKAYDYTHVWELPFWYVMSVSGVTVDSVPAEAAYSTVLASDSLTGLIRTELFALAQTPIGPQWLSNSSGPVTPLIRSRFAIAAQAVSTIVFETAGAIRLSEVNPGSFLLITDGVNEEICQVTEVFDQQLVVDRGLMDTQPAAWPAGTVVYAIGARNFPVDLTQRSVGEMVSYKPLMVTQIGANVVYDVPVETAVLQGRFAKPYPPNNIQVNGQLFPAVVSASASAKTFTLTWAQRNRLLQLVPVQVRWTDGSITPEPGTTYSIRVRQAAGVVAAMNGVTGTSATVTMTTPVSGPATLEMWSEIDGDPSYTIFKHQFTLMLT